MDTLRRFKYWQMRTIVAAMVGYALFYFVRKNFSLAMPGLESEFGITKVQLGVFLSANGVIYGLSRFINGFIADRASSRKMMVVGLVLSAVVNFAFGFSDVFARLFSAGGSVEFMTALVIFMGVMWVINGYLQGMGVPPVSRLMTHWVPANELATKMSIWNTSHSIGAGLVVVLCGFLMNHYGMGAWRLCFVVPASISFVGALALWAALRDSPKDVGLPEVRNSADASADEEVESREEYRRFVRRQVFGNRIIWTLAVVNFFVYIVRFAVLDWGPTLLSESRGVSLAEAAIMVAVFELVGGNLGMVVAGWATDRFFKSRAHRTCVVCMVGVVLSILAFVAIPNDAAWFVKALPFTMIGFFIYGPQALLGIEAANQATKRAAASANGLLGLFGYASTLVSGVGFGYVAQLFGWGNTYAVMVGISIVGMLILLTIWNASADGYDRAAK